jgi:hypothetical protein
MFFRAPAVYLAGALASLGLPMRKSSLLIIATLFLFSRAHHAREAGTLAPNKDIVVRTNSDASRTLIVNELDQSALNSLMCAVPDCQTNSTPLTEEELDNFRNEVTRLILLFVKAGAYSAQQR